MHCSANVGADGQVAVFFGLSGTGKTTLSADPTRCADRRRRARLGHDGVFNFEGGCYAKTIRLEPAGRAGDLEGRALLRDGARERRDRRARRHSTSTTTRRPRTPAAAYKLELIAQRAAGEAGRPSVDGDLPDRGRVRDPAADRAAHPRRRRSTTSSPASPRSSPAPRSASPSRSRPSRPASASRSCHSRPRSTRACSARSSTSTARRSGSSTPAGPAAPSARASGCRSRRPARCCTPRSKATSTSADYPHRRRLRLPGSARRCRASTQACSTPARTWADPDAYDAKARELAAMFVANFDALRRRRHDPPRRSERMKPSGSRGR